MDHVTAELGVAQRLACGVLGQHRSTQRKARCRPDDEAALTQGIIDLASEYKRYGDRRITALLHAEGWACKVIVKMLDQRVSLLGKPKSLQVDNGRSSPGGHGVSA